MPDLTAFLNARITEDEAEIGPASDCDCYVEGLPLLHGVRCPVRMLAECETKRRIIELHADRPIYGAKGLADGVIGHICHTCGSGEPYEYPVDWPCDTLKHLASPYAAHPDFDPSWRVE